jgi:hypothetical protein
MTIEDLIRSASSRGVVVAPKPEPGSVTEGWMSRIAAVERLLAGHGEGDALPRIYVNPHYEDDRSPQPRIRTGSDGIVEVCVDARWSAQFTLLRELVCRARWVYVHTVHLARFLVPFVEHARVYVDVHGIAPEEEAMYGNGANAAFFEAVERRVWRGAEGIVTVTAAMREHLERKHGPREARCLVLPIFEGGHAAARASREPAAVPTVVYAGGAQRWQCVDEMISLVAAVGDRARWVFLSHEPHEFTSRLSARGITSGAEVRSVSKSELDPYYLRADYGLVVRDPIAVNRVSCPTKLIEYLKYGIIPIVKFRELGDFPELGYQAVTADDFAAGRLPDAAAQESIRQANFTALERFSARYDESARTLREVFGQPPESRSSAAVPPLESMSTLELTSGGTAFATVSEVDPSGTARHDRLNTATYQREKRIPLSGRPIRELRMRPVQGPFIARAYSAAFRDREGNELPARIDYRGACCTGDLCVSTLDQAGEIVLTPVRATASPFVEALVSVDLVAEGPEVQHAAPAQASGGATVRAAHGELSDWVELLKKSRRRLRARLGLS